MGEPYWILCASALLAGMANSVAGGGTLLTFPALVYVLGPGAEAAVVANATSTIALVPGSIASVWGYRREVVHMGRWAALLAPASLLGGLVGALLVVLYDPRVFARLVPWLILAAASLFALQPQIARWTGIGQPHARPTRTTLAMLIGGQFLVSVYGGYFGAAAGIMMLAGFAMMGFDNIHQMNALKSSLGTLINVIAVGVFALDGKIRWDYAAAMAVAAAVGGYLGSSTARRIDKRWVRTGVVFIGFALAAWYFWRR